jgi:hypothetical protein
VEDNEPALRISRGLGYEPNGTMLHDRGGAPVRALEFVLTRSNWEPRRRRDIRIAGLEPCLSMLGLP